MVQDSIKMKVNLKTTISKQNYIKENIPITYLATDF